MSDKPCFTTIVTGTHIPWVLVQYESVKAYCAFDFSYYVLCCDYEAYSYLSEIEADSVIPIYWRDIATAELLEIHDQKIQKGKVAEFCFLTKPVILEYLITEKSVGKVVYLDADILCLSNPSELFEKYLVNNDFCLTPHFNEGDYQKYDQTSGKINAGVVAVSERATEFVRWWKENCFQKCEWDPSVTPGEGGAVDQGYLERAVELFENVKLLGREFNLAVWNAGEAKNSHDKVIYDAQEAVFFHLASHKYEDGILRKTNAVRKLDLDLYEMFETFERQAKEKNDYSFQDDVIESLPSDLVMQHLAGQWGEYRNLFTDQKLSLIDKYKIYYRLCSQYADQISEEVKIVVYQKIAYSKAFLADDLRGSAFFKLGLIHEKNHESEKAQSCFEACLVRIPEHQAAYQQLTKGEVVPC